MSVDEATSVDARGASAGWDVGRSAGRLIVAWQHPESRLISPVGLLEHADECDYAFRYLRRAATVAGFRPFLSFPAWDRVYTAEWLFPFFAERIMSPRRPDYEQFLAQLHLDGNASPWEQLARSEGRSSGDPVQVFPIPVVHADGTATCRFLVHGIRHVRGETLPRLAVGDRLELVAEPSNPYNPAAILVCADGLALGYVPDLLLEHVGALRSSGEPIRATVEHVNGPEAPPHLRLLVRLDGTVPAGYEPMSGPGWEPFVE